MENTRKLVSIIIPIYKVENYIHRCLNSVIHQTYSNLEIILVDDGSPDRCPEICDEYSTLDSRIKVIHQKNRGVSAARNAALKIITGTYVTFIDPDDYVEPEYVEVLVGLMEENNAEYAHCRCFSDKRTINQADRNVWKISDRDFVEYRCHTTVWSHCYSRDLIQRNNILFDENISVGEDTLFNTLCYLNCNNAYATNWELYYYELGSAGVTRVGFAPKKMTLFLAIDSCLQAMGSERRFLYRYFTQIKSGWALGYLVELENMPSEDRKKRCLEDFSIWESELIHIMRRNILPFLTKKDEDFKIKIIYVLIALLGKYYFRLHPPKYS